MADMESIHQKADEVIAKYPHERERIEKCVEVIRDGDSEMLYRALEGALDRILSASSPVQATKRIHKMEHTLMESRLLSPFLGAREGNAGKRAWIVGVLVFLGIVVVALQVFLELRT